METVYIIGSLKNWNVIELANDLRKEFPDMEIFDSWISPGPEADDYWKKYSKMKGLTYKEALKDWCATHVFEFDKFHIDRSTTLVMHMPCGKSGHLELGYAIGQGKRALVYFEDDTEREVLYKLPHGVYTDLDELKKKICEPYEVKKIEVKESDGKKICLIGDLTSEDSKKKANAMAEKIRGLGFEVVEDWHVNGADGFEPKLLEECDKVVLYEPSSKLGHLELGYALGLGKKGYILFDKEPATRWDVMYQFASAVCMEFDELVSELRS